MYNPIQMPYVLSHDFLQHIQYCERVAEELSNFVICFWEMAPLSAEKGCIKNIVVADGCIDLVVDFKAQQLGFTGIRHTQFDFCIHYPAEYLGVRMLPGAFYQLTGEPASAVMDNFIPLINLDCLFDEERFFSLSMADAREYLVNYLRAWIGGREPDACTTLFHTLYKDVPNTVAELCNRLHLSQQQCQHLFDKHFGLSPKMALSILRFQRCLGTLTSVRAEPGEVHRVANHYDQSHFINDFRRNMGITPFELIEHYI